MITIFCDFCLFSAKKLAFFSKTIVMITIFPKTSSSLIKKLQFFRQIFRRKYFKNHNIGPWLDSNPDQSDATTTALHCHRAAWACNVIFIFDVILSFMFINKLKRQKCKKLHCKEYYIKSSLQVFELCTTPAL
jgi:hypothetical protein